MMLSLDKQDLAIANAVVSNFSRTIAASQPKPGSTGYKLLAAYDVVKEKLAYVSDLIHKPDYIGDLVSLELNRVEAKAIIAGLVTSRAMQDKVMEEYKKRPPDHASFADKEGRRKEDYETALELRIKETTALMEKIRRSL